MMGVACTDLFVQRTEFTMSNMEVPTGDLSGELDIAFAVWLRQAEAAIVRRSRVNDLSREFAIVTETKRDAEIIQLN